jgi:hypothetical protein
MCTVRSGDALAAYVFRCLISQLPDVSDVKMVIMFALLHSVSKCLFVWTREMNFPGIVGSTPASFGSRIYLFDLMVEAEGG